MGLTCFLWSYQSTSASNFPCSWKVLLCSSKAQYFLLLQPNQSLQKKKKNCVSDTSSANIGLGNSCFAPGSVAQGSKYHWMSAQSVSLEALESIIPFSWHKHLLGLKNLIWCSCSLLETLSSVSLIAFEWVPSTVQLQMEIAFHKTVSIFLFFSLRSFLLEEICCSQQRACRGPARHLCKLDFFILFWPVDFLGEGAQKQCREHLGGKWMSCRPWSDIFQTMSGSKVHSSPILQCLQELDNIIKHRRPRVDLTVLVCFYLSFHVLNTKTTTRSSNSIPHSNL